MTKKSYHQDIDQYDPKIFRESLGNFGSTTKPGGNQLTELQAMVRRGVKHVELHLNSAGKGAFGEKDTPDKYGFEERRTIMQLAKMNNQTLSVHSTLNTVSFSGFGQQGFDEAQRLDALKEIDESVKFAAETAKGGAIVMHMQGEGISANRTDLNLSTRYLEWLKNNNQEKYKEEYKRIQENYLNKNPFERRFNENPVRKQDLRREFELLDKQTKSEIENLAKTEEKYKGKTLEQIYYEEQEMRNLKTSQDYRSTVVVGNKVEKVDRNQRFVDYEKLTLENRKNLSENQLKLLEQEGVFNKDHKLTGEGLQRAQALFTNGKPTSVDMSNEEFEDLRKELLVDYEKVLHKSDYSQNQADTKFYKKLSGMQLESFKLQRQDLEDKYNIYRDELKRIEELEKDKRNIYNQMTSITGNSDEEKSEREILKLRLNEVGENVTRLKYNIIGQDNYQELAQFDERISQYNEKIRNIEEQTKGAVSLADSTFEKNVSGIGYMGIKALKYQLDLKEKARTAEENLKKTRDEIENKKKEYMSSNDFKKQDELAYEISKLEREERKLVGLKDYADIDVEKNPLYIAPENMLPGMGNLCGVEEFKAVVRMSQEDFKSKILENKSKTFEEIREKYEKETGKKIDEKEAEILAKRHVSGTFDSAHAAAWLKHFRYKDDETDEDRLFKFNEWLKDEAVKMVEEGLVKHVHLNDSSGKDDDHNSIGSGMLDLHDLRKRLREAKGGNLDKAFIIEAGGRGADKMLHLDSAFNLFNPTLAGGDENSRLSIGNSIDSGTSDWMSVKRDYNTRPQYSSYGMNESTFRHIPPQEGRDRGGWTGTSFF